MPAGLHVLVIRHTTNKVLGWPLSPSRHLPQINQLRANFPVSFLSFPRNVECKTKFQQYFVRHRSFCVFLLRETVEYYLPTTMVWSSSKPHSCAFCQSSFNRPDSLKRHWTTCKVRREKCLDIPHSTGKRKGRKPTACDRCSRLKRACIPERHHRPCQLCVISNKTCSYSRATHADPHQREHTANGNTTTIIIHSVKQTGELSRI